MVQLQMVYLKVGKTQRNDKIKFLGEVEKLAYDSWKATQNKKIETNNPSYKQETKPDIVTPAIKSTIKKIDNFGNTIEETEGEFGTGAQKSLCHQKL